MRILEFTYPDAAQQRDRCDFGAVADEVAHLSREAPELVAPFLVLVLSREWSDEVLREYRATEAQMIEIRDRVGPGGRALVEASASISRKDRWRLAAQCGLLPHCE